MSQAGKRRDVAHNARRRGALVSLIAVAACLGTGLSGSPADAAPLRGVYPIQVVVGSTAQLPATTAATRSLARRAVAAAPARLRSRVAAAAFNPADGLTYALTRRSLVRLDSRGARHGAASLSGLGLNGPEHAAFGRSSDPTDVSTNLHLYVDDRGGRPASRRIVEVGLASGKQTVSAAAVSEVAAPYLRSIDTSAFSPSSPDPAGLAYDQATDSFIIGDSEVEEMPLYKGFNLFTLPRGSTAGFGTGTTVGRFSNEPTGLSINPADRTLYVSDDDGNRVTVDRPGADGKHGTADDSFYRFSTAAVGVVDAEDVAFDTATGHLFVCDGVGLEMWEIDPVNGTFGDAGDVVGHFDLAVHGMRDCEGVGIDALRNTLLAVDPTRTKAFELTKSGSLARIIDLTSIPTTERQLSDIEIAPTSDPTDAPGTMAYWVVDRHVDNGPDPSENDGLIHELGFPADPPADAPPSVSVTAPAAGTTVTGTTTVRAAATDDKGVAQVRFLVDGTSIGTDSNGADGWSLGWATTSTTDGSHSITAVATDTAGNSSASAAVAVTVHNPPVRTLTVRVSGGSDDADQARSGSVRRTAREIKLGGDKGRTTAGVRFSGLAIPRGATIRSATIQFRADKSERSSGTFTLRAQASDSASAFTSAAFDLSSRPKTTAAVSWSVPEWVGGAAGTKQRTPDLTTLLQEVVNRPGWASGNALAVLVSGTTQRTADSYEGGYATALTVEFSVL